MSERDRIAAEIGEATRARIAAETGAILADDAAELAKPPEQLAAERAERARHADPILRDLIAAGVVEPSESLTLDDDARTRAAKALSAALKGGHERHYCAEWSEDGECEICWDIAADVIRAAEGLRKCSQCNGGGMVAPGDCCPQCGGNGLEALDG